MKRGLGVFIWQLAVALYLIAIGVLAFNKGGQLVALIQGIGINNATIFIIAGIIALIAGIAVLLEMFDVQISILELLVLIIAIIWAVFIVIQLIGWITSGFAAFWSVLSQISVNIMVLASLLVASKKFG